MARFQVIVGIYKDGDDESLSEETLLETDSRADADELVLELVAHAADEGDDDEADDDDQDE